jgi:hypothetical protein
MDPEAQVPPEQQPTFWVRLTTFLSWLASEEATPYVEMGLFLASFVVLWVSIDMGCTICVFVVLLISMFFCCRFRYMFFVLWASIGVLWIHGWRFGAGKGLSVQWN